MNVSITLSERMREAAKVIEEASQEYHRRSPDGSWLARNWRSSDLISWADQWEREDLEQLLVEGRRKAQINELAKIIEVRLQGHVAGIGLISRGIARDAIDAGWRNS
jgi:hypothetical protein